MLADFTHRLFAIVVLGLMATFVTACGQTAGSVADRSTFATTAEAKELLRQDDDFTQSWSQFDIDSRLQKPAGTKEELLSYIADQARDWSPEEKDTIVSILQRIDEQIDAQKLDIALPEQVFFVKTTSAEESGANGYTRGNYIVIGEGAFSKPQAELARLIVHELFHVLSRHDAKFRETLFSMIGFELVNEIKYPEEIAAHRITNPDATRTDHLIRLEVDGVPIQALMILYSDVDYSEGSFFEYLNVGFLALTDTSTKKARFEDGKPVIFTFAQVSGFYEKVGQNTGYIIHPEEILAENFAHMILETPDLPNPEIIDAIRRNLQK